MQLSKEAERVYKRYSKRKEKEERQEEKLRKASAKELVKQLKQQQREQDRKNREQRRETWKRSILKLRKNSRDEKRTRPQRIEEEELKRDQLDRQERVRQHLESKQAKEQEKLAKQKARELARTDTREGYHRNFIRSRPFIRDVNLDWLDMETFYSQAGERPGLDYHLKLKPNLLQWRENSVEWVRYYTKPLK